MRDLVCDQTFCNALLLNGYVADACLMFILGRAFEAGDQRGLTTAYRQMCLDRLDYAIRCMFGKGMWMVGHLGSPIAGKVTYGLAKGHVRGFPRDGLLALLVRDAVRNLLIGESEDLCERAQTQLDLESGNNLFAVSRSSGYRHSMRVGLPALHPVPSARCTFLHERQGQSRAFSLATAGRRR